MSNPVIICQNSENYSPNWEDEMQSFGGDVEKPCQFACHSLHLFAILLSPAETTRPDDSPMIPDSAHSIDHWLVPQPGVVEFPPETLRGSQRKNDSDVVN